jgi:hypothetical protein
MYSENKKKLLFLSFVVIALVLFHSGGLLAYAAEDTSSPGFWATVGSGLLWALNSLLYGIFLVAAWTVDLAAGILEFALNPKAVNTLFNLDAVYVVWQMVRDFFNLFFILTLLFIAFATIFQISKYNYKALLKTLLLMALLVNFSWPISRFIVDATNVPMYFFLGNMFDSGSKGAAGGSRVAEVSLQTSGIKELVLPEYNPDMNITGSSKLTVKLLVAIVFIFLFGVSLSVLGILLLVRTIVLVLLVAFSPVGFAGLAIPGFQDQAHKWWSNFLNYALFGPAAMLVLLAAVAFMKGFNLPATQDQLTALASTDGAINTSNVIKTLIPIILVWISIGTGQSMGIAGAGMVTDHAKKFSKWVGKKPFQLGGFIDRKYEKKMAEGRSVFGQYGKFLAPRAVYEGIKQRSEEQKEQDMSPIHAAAGSVQDKLNAFVSRFTGAHGENLIRPTRWMKPGIDRTEHEFGQVSRQTSEAQKKLSDVSTKGDYVINEVKNAIKNGKVDDVAAGLQILAKNNDLNDFVTDGAISDMYKDRKRVDENGNEVDLLDKDKDGNVIVSSKNMANLLQAVLTDSGEKNADILAKRMMTIGDIATNAGNFAFGGMVGYDRNLEGGFGGFEINSEKKMAEFARAKVQNLESQKRQQMIHPDSLFTRTKDGFGDINGEVAKAVISTFTNADIGQANRSRDDLKEAVYNAYQHLNEDGYEGFSEIYNNQNDPQSKIFRDYVEQIRIFKEAKPEKEGENKAGARPNESEVHRKNRETREKHGR